MKKLLVICGPTATGKTGLAVKLANQFNGELVSADSRQVYQGLDIITGKDQPAGARIWLLDVVKPDYRFSAGDYVAAARLVIEDIWRRDKLAIVVGGTGFYIKALIDGVEALGVKPDWKLRQKLAHCSIAQLLNCLKKLNPERLKKMNKSDRHNPRRLIRAIEIAKQNQSASRRTKFKINNLLMIGLKAPLGVLDQRIDRRVKERLQQGAVEEIKKLLATGYNWDNSVLGETIGYREWQRYFEGLKVSKLKSLKLKEEAIQKWQIAEHQYARRQMTWFKKDKRIKWFDITSKNWEKKVVKLVKEWYIEIDAEKS